MYVFVYDIYNISVYDYGLPLDLLDQFFPPCPTPEHVSLNSVTGHLASIEAPRPIT